MTHAEMAELADALDSGSSEHYAHAGSSPVFRTRSSSRNGFRYDYFFAVSFILAQSTAEEGIASVEVGFFLPLRNL